MSLAGHAFPDRSAPSGRRRGAVAPAATDGAACMSGEIGVCLAWTPLRPEAEDAGSGEDKKARTGTRSVANKQRLEISKTLHSKIASPILSASACRLLSSRLCIVPLSPLSSDLLPSVRSYRATRRGQLATICVYASVIPAEPCLEAPFGRSLRERYYLSPSSKARAGL